MLRTTLQSQFSSLPQKLKLTMRIVSSGRAEPVVDPSRHSINKIAMEIIALRSLEKQVCWLPLALFSAAHSMPVE
jgi:hypothetical protein